MTIPIVFCFDKRIILGASVAIKSLIECAKPDTTYDIRIFHSDIPEKTQSALRQLVFNTRHKMKFHFIDESLFADAPCNSGSWKRNVYYRLLTPEILKEYDKAIYSDVDVLFKKDLQEVFSADIENFEIAAPATCTTQSIKEYNPKRFFKENKNDKNYISSFILFNNKRMREEKTVRKFFDTIDKFKDRLVYFDMDALNLTCTKIKPLPLNYTVFESLLEYTDPTKISEYNVLKSLYSVEKLKQMAQDPVIIHYAGALGKPWQRKWIPEYYKEYIDKLPKNLVRHTLRDLRKKYFGKNKFPEQHFDVALVNFFHSQNHGACLTAYALQELIKDLGYSVAFVNEFDVRDKYKLSFGTLFVNRYLRRAPKFNNLKRAGEIADIFISGSDQVFRPEYLKKSKNRNLFLLNFASPCAKKAAFSASFGIGEEEIKKSKQSVVKEIKKSLETFDYVSTRELSGTDICKNIFNIFSEQIIDPVFLLDKKRFEELAEKSEKDFKGKIVAYLLNETENAESLLKEIGEKYNLPVCKMSRFEYSVEDWLKAFMQAEYIITDSFHGSCFPLIFNKKFIAIANKKRGSARFDSLAKIFNLEECFIGGIQDLKNASFAEINWEKVNRTISKEKERGLEALKEVLRLKKNNFITNNCTGCGACSNACPFGAITMRENFEGFLYPRVDSKKCTNCGLCQKTCPTNSPSKNANFENPQCYAVMADDFVRMSGVSSGGASTIMMDYFLKNGGYVVGAIYDDEWKAIHKISNKEEDLKLFKGSKYYQSDTLNVYKETKKILSENKPVLFTGTPCQIAGLKNFLKKDCENLITVDIVCHGTPSYKSFKMFLENAVSQDEKIESINFRDKKRGWNSEFTVSIKTEKSEYNSNSSQNPFVSAFLKNLSIRKSCFTCPFQSTPRQGDITIGDFWKVAKYKKDLDDGKGTSILLVNSPKGAVFFENIKHLFARSENTPYKAAIRGNSTLVKPTKFNHCRDEFLLSLTKNNFNELVKKYLKNKYKG